MANNSVRSSNRNLQQKTPALYEVLEGRRKYPRIKLNTPIKLKKSKSSVEAIVYDISIDGLQIRCDRQAAMVLHPSGKFIKEGKGPNVDVTFKLSLEEKTNLVKVKCQIYYLAVVSDKQFAFGLVFKKFIDNSARIVDNFILDYITPVDEKIRCFLDEPRSHNEISSHMKMEVNEVDEVLDRLRIRGEVISFEKDSNTHHLKLSAAVSSIFQKLEQLDKRLSQLEKPHKKR